MINITNYTTYNKNLFLCILGLYLILSRKKKTNKDLKCSLLNYLLLYYINICNDYKSLIAAVS